MLLLPTHAWYARHRLQPWLAATAAVLVVLCPPLVFGVAGWLPRWRLLCGVVGVLASARKALSVPKLEVSVLACPWYVGRYVGRYVGGR